MKKINNSNNASYDAFDLILKDVYEEKLAETKPTENCPSAEILEKYLNNELDTNEINKIKKHILECDYCSFWATEILSQLETIGKVKEKNCEKIVVVNQQQDSSTNPIEESWNISLPQLVGAVAGEEIPIATKQFNIQRYLMSVVITQELTTNNIIFRIMVTRGNEPVEDVSIVIDNEKYGQTNKEGKLEIVSERKNEYAILFKTPDIGKIIKITIR